MPEISKDPFVTFNEIRRDEDNDNFDVIKWYIRVKGNEEQLDYFEKDILALKNPSYKIDMRPIPEFEVNVLCKYTIQGYWYFHNKLDGKLDWRNKIDEAIMQKNRIDLSYEIGKNFRYCRQKNERLFEKFDIQPTYYLIFEMIDEDGFEYSDEPLCNANFKKTAVQLNGNEKELALLVKDLKEQNRFGKDLRMEEIVAHPIPESIDLDHMHVIVGKFNYSNSLIENFDQKKRLYIESVISDCRIREFVEPFFLIS